MGLHVVKSLFKALLYYIRALRSGKKARQLVNGDWVVLKDETGKGHKFYLYRWRQPGETRYWWYARNSKGKIVVTGALTKDQAISFLRKWLGEYYEVTQIP